MSQHVLTGKVVYVTEKNTKRTVITVETGEQRYPITLPINISVTEGTYVIFFLSTSGTPKFIGCQP